MRKYIFHLIACLISLAACEDEQFYDSSAIGKGTANVTAEITFKSLAPALNSRAVAPEGGTPGDAIKDIQSVCIVLYKLDGTFAGKYFFDQPKVTDTDENPADRPGADDPENAHRAEQFTKKATANLPGIPYGRYYMYAVANVPETALTDEVLASADALKQLQLKWNADHIAANNQMFGYFSADNMSVGFDAPIVTVNKPSVTLHAWIKRAVSKVTVAFDGTNLNRGVEIFIRSVAIRDIPATCLLGAANGSSDPKATGDTELALVSEGQVMTYGGTNEGETYNDNWVGYVSQEHPINGYDQQTVNNGTLSKEAKLKALHSETTPAFYLFENMQGKGEYNTPSDKWQQVNDQHRENGVISYPDGVDPTDKAWKDSKPYGSYIEVKAHYKSGNDKEGEGEITYRFMLGKDNRLDYNAERNYHYKLTLKFNYWANDVDWHIDYKKDDEPPLRIPRPFYISYLYNHNAMVPLEFDAPKEVEIKSIEATIEENNWYPMNTGNAYTGPGDKLESNDKNAAVNNTYYSYIGMSTIANGKKDGGKPWNGFLSLRRPLNAQEVTSADNTIDGNKPHYTNNHLGYRTYTKDAVKISDFPAYEAIDKDSLHVSWDNGTYYLKLPIWTRALKLITPTGYTGNNPYEYAYREARINIKVTLSDGRILNSNDLYKLGDNKGEHLQIKQVRRLTNPKGIYHRGNNTDPFNVRLMVLPDDNATQFTDLTSDGPWRAYVIRNDQGVVSLEGDKMTTESDYTFMFNNEVMTHKAIEGLDGTVPAFKIKFNGTCSDEAPRYAIIRVEYNHYSCYHLIFVRQGYGADAIVEGGSEWCIGNQVNKNEYATNPLNEGSMFKLGNWDQYCPASRNTNGIDSWIKVTPNYFKKNEYNEYDHTEWEAITIKKVEDSFTDPNSEWQVAGLDDYKQLKWDGKGNEADCPIRTGYGICYADGATQPAVSIQDAFGYLDEKNGDSSKGMRGCFVYNTKNGKSLFFPIGNSGYGHRRDQWPNGQMSLYGLLQYSCGSRWGYYKNATNTDSGINAPILMDIFRHYGGLYYLKEPKSVGSDTKIGWDINYSTFLFDAIDSPNLNKGKNACFVRCVKKK